jgi:16S rRNA (guanine1207-N2)-methyltransferase
MTDHALHTLIDAMHAHDGPGICVADAAFAELNASLPARQWQYLSNRWDVAQALSRKLSAGQIQFSDFDFSQLHWPEQREPGQIFHSPPIGVFFRIAKEKAVNHRVINQCRRWLRSGDTITLCGYKQEGIQSLVSRVDGAFQVQGESVLTGQTVRRVRWTLNTHYDTQADLPDDDYPNLRPILTWNDQAVMSKPGLFGWDRVDPGSQLLIDTLPAFLENTKPNESSLLDLGCGYGLLSLAASNWRFRSIVATDNNAAALAACAANFKSWRIEGEVLPSDCAREIDTTFDIVLCNPPFHQGFETSRSLTESFLAETARHLRPNGRALFVVNQFIALERLAGTHFRHIRKLAVNKQFKVIELGLKSCSLI